MDPCSTVLSAQQRHYLREDPSAAAALFEAIAAQCGNDSELIQLALARIFAVSVERVAHFQSAAEGCSILAELSQVSDLPAASGTAGCASRSDEIAIPPGGYVRVSTLGRTIECRVIGGCPLHELAACLERQHGFGSMVFSREGSLVSLSDLVFPGDELVASPAPAKCVGLAEASKAVAQAIQVEVLPRDVAGCTTELLAELRNSGCVSLEFRIHHPALLRTPGSCRALFSSVPPSTVQLAVDTQVPGGALGR
mmetsp:Transcript_34017/g.88807  ORF Transcript_34017/g.88807 Transcript_34017/m.88807 type:complete len:253 (+) Transcript_34017:1241-1999(+)